ncbi:unnamed protein product [Arctogadus glacialis]
MGRGLNKEHVIRRCGHEGGTECQSDRHHGPNRLQGPQEKQETFGRKSREQQHEITETAWLGREAKHPGGKRLPPNNPCQMLTYQHLVLWPRVSPPPPDNLINTLINTISHQQTATYLQGRSRSW